MILKNARSDDLDLAKIPKEFIELQGRSQDHTKGDSEFSTSLLSTDRFKNWQNTWPP